MIRSLPLFGRTNTFLARFMSAYASNPVGSELLMTCTTRRWLYNNDTRKSTWSELIVKGVDDPVEMALRHINFDVEALGAIAAKACGASECNEIEVIGEGHPNILPETNILNPFQGHSTAYFASVSTPAMMSSLVFPFVTLDH
jgi:hypothetical protein